MVHQPCSRVDLERGADHQHHIGRLDLGHGLGHEGHFLAKPHDVWPQRCAPGVALVGGLVLVPGDAPVGPRGAAQLGELAVQVQHMAAACALVQVVHVLGDDAHLVPCFQRHQRLVGGVGPHCAQLAPAGVVEVDHALRVGCKGLGRGHVLDAVSLPQAARTPEGLQAAVGADACAREHDAKGLVHRIHAPPFMRSSISCTDQQEVCPASSASRARLRSTPPV